MGFFDFLFKKKTQESTPTVSVSIGEVPPVEQKKSIHAQFQPVDIGDYVSPSGGFVNYANFIVVGKNATTNRKNTKRYEVQTEQDAKNAAAAEGLVEPFTITVVPMREPSEAQRNYAHNLGVVIPEGACLEDVSAIISRVVDEDKQKLDAELAKYVHSLKVHFSRFIGTKRLLGSLPGISVDSWGIVQFTYSLYMLDKGKAFQGARACEFYKALSEFSARAAKDKTIVKSLDGLGCYDIADVHKRTKIYIAAAEFLKDWI